MVFSMQLPVHPVVIMLIITYFVTIAVVVPLCAFMDLACNQTSIVISFNWVELKFKENNNISKDTKR